jgi:hypothetical protein
LDTLTQPISFRNHTAISGWRMMIFLVLQLAIGYSRERRLFDTYMKESYPLFMTWLLGKFLKNFRNRGKSMRKQLIIKGGTPVYTYCGATVFGKPLPIYLSEP